MTSSYWPSEQTEAIDSNLQRVMLNDELINKQQVLIRINKLDSVFFLSESLENFASGTQLFVEERMFKLNLNE